MPSLEVLRAVAVHTTSTLPHLHHLRYSSPSWTDCPATAVVGRWRIDRIAVRVSEHQLFHASALCCCVERLVNTNETHRYCCDCDTTQWHGINFIILWYRDAQQDANGNHNHGGGGGYHAHSHSNSNGGAVVGGGGGCGMEHEQDNAEEARRLQERVKEVDVACLRYHNAANETQALLEVRTTYSAVGSAVAVRMECLYT